MFGTPGAGKSSLIWRLIDATGGLEAWPQVEHARLVAGHRNATLGISLIGRYEPGFAYGGVDRLAMNVQPSAEAFIASTSDHVVVEGDRLSNQKFYSALCVVPGVSLVIARLVVNPALVRERQITRGDDRTETFLRSRETKYDNILTAFDGIRIFDNNTLEQQSVIFREMCSHLGVSL